MTTGRLSFRDSVGSLAPDIRRPSGEAEIAYQEQALDRHDGTANRALFCPDGRAASRMDDSSVPMKDGPFAYGMSL